MEDGGIPGAVARCYGAFNAGDDQAVASLFHPEGGFGDLAELRAMLADVAVEVRRCHTGADHAVAEITVTGTVGTNGKRLTLPAVHYFEFEGGRIRRLRAYRLLIDEPQRDGAG